MHILSQEEFKSDEEYVYTHVTLILVLQISYHSHFYLTLTWNYYFLQFQNTFLLMWLFYLENPFKLYLKYLFENF